MDRRTSRTSDVARGVALAVACMVTYYIIVGLLSLVPAVGLENDKLGGMWAVIATIFVYRQSLATSRRSALSRLSATLVAFGLCLVYLLLLPFTGVGLAVLVGFGAIIVSFIGRAEDVITTGISITVVMVVAGLGPRSAAWEQPILRLVDTLVGMGVGLALARVADRAARGRA